MGNEDSILISMRKLNGVAEDDSSFDTDIIAYTNTALMILNDLGIGPEEGFFIDDETGLWSEYAPSNRIIAEAIKTFVFIKVKLVFDPPASPTVLDALRSSKDECEWRIREWAKLQ